MTRTAHIQPNTTSGTTPADRTVVHTGERDTDGFGTLTTHNIQYHSALKTPPISGEGLGRGFFGARYYDAGLSVWLSVDPMANKYPDQSPYSYVGNRPIMVIDPNGEDEYEVNPEGVVTWINRPSDVHTLFVVDNQGNRVEGKSLTLNDKCIFDQLSDGRDEKGIISATGDKPDADLIYQTFKFLAENTNVEWAVYRSDNSFVLGSFANSDFEGAPTFKDLGLKLHEVRSFIHSHPGVQPNESAERWSMGYSYYREDGARPFANGDLAVAVEYARRNGGSQPFPYYTYFPNSRRLYHTSSKPGSEGHAYIRNIGNDYRRFYFGTLR